MPPGKQIGTAIFSGGVKLTTSDGIVVTSATATYNDDEQMARIPGPLDVQEGAHDRHAASARPTTRRATSCGCSTRPRWTSRPTRRASGAIHVTSKTAGMARAEHYMKFQGDGAPRRRRDTSPQADDVTAFLTEDDERMTRMELRGNSRMTGKPGGSGPQDMRANDIDLAYAEDGRTLQSARLVENASVQLPGEKGKAGRRIAGKAIDIALAPDGATVTNLAANENVQVDLPPDGDTPARRIRSASLLATGAPGAGIQAATFSGDVEFRESARRARQGRRPSTAPRSPPAWT